VINNRVLVDPTDLNKLYVCMNNAGVFRSTDGGDHWSALNNELTDLRVWTLELDHNDPNVLYAGTNGSSIFRLDLSGGGPWRRPGSRSGPHRASELQSRWNLASLVGSPVGYGAYSPYYHSADEKLASHGIATQACTMDVALLDRFFATAGDGKRIMAAGDHARNFTVQNHGKVEDEFPANFGDVNESMHLSTSLPNADPELQAIRQTRE
jgi:hypothetical protein